VTLTVASTVGNIVSAALYPYAPAEAWLTTIFSMVMLVVGLAYALKYIVMFLQRLIVSGYPTGLSIMSSFIPLGPLCQSGYSFLLFAENFQTQLPLTTGSSTFLRSELAGPILYAICLCAGFTLWALSTAWIVFTLLAIGHVVRREKIGFGPTYWGLIFPNVSDPQRPRKT
jgi:tellurite resistance protein TehA-like permease